MQAVKQTSPYVRKQVSTKRMMTDVLIALIPAVMFSIYRFGWDAVIRILVSLVVMVGLEAVAFGMMQKPSKSEKFIERLKSRYQAYTINNITAPAISAIIFAMLVPSKIEIYAVVMGAAFGIIIGKMLFGGLGANIFNPAAAGRIFIALALTGMFSNAYVDVDAITGATALSSNLAFPNILNHYSLSQLFLGQIPGAMGEISALAILIGAAYLIIRRSADFRVMLSGVATFTILMFIVGLKLVPDFAFQYVLFQLLSGGLLFGMVFMITDPVTSPITRPGRWIYGLLVGGLVVLMRLFGDYPEGVAFAILFANMFVPLLDYPKWSTNVYKPSFLIGIACALFVLIAIVYFGASPEIIGGVS
ncbi:MAG: RnfABCDGE type electron transport complex subunit D [Acholeplasmataceae bacterium]|nr:RnfABCDGE type electron transport complex subunit D [Acholeplasmataceae bacterium]